MGMMLTLPDVAGVRLGEKCNRYTPLTTSGRKVWKQAYRAKRRTETHKGTLDPLPVESTQANAASAKRPSTNTIDRPSPYPMLWAEALSMARAIFSVQ